jgi:hypothetical protein
MVRRPSSSGLMPLVSAAFKRFCLPDAARLLDDAAVGVNSRPRN